MVSKKPCPKPPKLAIKAPTLPPTIQKLAKQMAIPASKKKGPVF